MLWAGDDAGGSRFPLADLPRPEKRCWEMFSPLGPLRLSPEAEQERRKEVLIKFARQVCRAEGRDPNSLPKAELLRLLKQVEDKFADVELGELIAFADMLRKRR